MDQELIQLCNTLNSVHTVSFSKLIFTYLLRDLAGFGFMEVKVTLSSGMTDGKLHINRRNGITIYAIIFQNKNYSENNQSRKAMQTVHCYIRDP